MQFRTLFPSFLFASLLTAVSQAAIVVTLSESGGNTLLTYSGSITTTGLIPLITLPTTASMQPSNGLIQNAAQTQLFLISATPASQSFGNGGSVSATTNSGSPVSLNFGASAIIGLPNGYASGASISGSMTFAGTFAALGITPNRSYTFSWGGGGSGKSVTLNVLDNTPPAAVPEPTSIAVFGLGLLGVAYRKRPKFWK